MPPYNTISPAPVLAEPELVYAFQNETPTTGELSQQFQVVKAGPVSIEVSYPSAPSNFEFDVVAADLDEQGEYTISRNSPSTAYSISGSSALGLVYRLDIPVFDAPYIAVRCGLASNNGVPVTVTIYKPLS